MGRRNAYTGENKSRLRGKVDFEFAVVAKGSLTVVSQFLSSKYALSAVRSFQRKQAGL
jgi:hypothetical protein